MNKNKFKNKKGAALLLAILLVSLVIFSSIYFLTFAINENKISKSQTSGAKAYYLAESGIAHMVWKLKHNASYETNFEENPTWAESFTVNNPFGTDSGSYTVSIINTSNAHGEITSTGEINIGNKKSKRTVKTFVYKALGQTGVQDSSGYADGNIDISGSIVNLYNGSAHSNNVFTVNGGAEVFVDSNLKAVGNYLESWTSSTTIMGEIFAANYPPAADEINMPAIDFNSSATSSYKNKADIVYTPSQFEDLMEANQVLTINDPIVYVTGDVAINGAQTIILNGLLVIERDMELGAKNTWEGRTGPSSLFINHATGTPSGVLAGRQINIKTYTDTVDADGVIYASDQINIVGLQAGQSNFDVRGGLVSRKLTITSSWQPVNITHDNEILLQVFEATEYSPVIIVEHWEEEY